MRVLTISQGAQPYLENINLMKILSMSVILNIKENVLGKVREKKLSINYFIRVKNIRNRSFKSNMIGHG